MSAQERTDTLHTTVRWGLALTEPCHLKILTELAEHRLGTGGVVSLERMAVALGIQAGDDEAVLIGHGAPLTSMQRSLNA
jgi:hypothetical protein